MDTNVLVSALLSPLGHPARVLQLVRSGTVTLLLSDPVLQEYREVLLRPRFGLEESLVDELISFLDRFGEWVVPSPLNLSLPDPDDIIFLELAVAGKADALITGNRKDFGPAHKRTKILSPKDFLDYSRSRI